MYVLCRELNVIRLLFYCIRMKCQLVNSFSGCSKNSSRYIHSISLVQLAAIVSQIPLGFEFLDSENRKKYKWEMFGRAENLL